MTDIGELSGPKVFADKDQTADSGGGQLAVLEGTLYIRGSVHSRALGQLDQLDRISFQDLAARTALLSFRDGTTWTLTDESDGQLLDFARQLAERMGMPALVVEAPSPKEQVKRFMTRERWLQLGGVAAALALAPLVRLIVSHAALVGYVLSVAVVIWLVVTALGRRTKAGSLQPAPQLPNLGWGWGIALPLGLLLGSALGLVDSVELARVEAEVQRAEDEKANALAAAERDKAAEQKREQRSVLRLITDMHAAMGAESWREAEQHYNEAKALRPEHVELAKAWALLEPRLEELNERDRRVALLTGISEAKRIVSDQVLCDSAKHVADAWKNLRAVGPDDEEWSQAETAAASLEECRKRIERNFSRNAAALRADERALSAPQWQAKLRSLGFAVNARVEGKHKDVLSVELKGLDDAIAAKLTGEASREQGSLLWQLEKAGMRALVLGDGSAASRRYELKPEDETGLGTAILEGFGLDKPLSLGG